MENSTRNKYLSQLFIEMYDQLRAFALSTFEKDYVEDVIQETFVIACRRYDDLIASPNPKGWIVQTLKYVIMRNRRTQHRWTQKTVPIANENTSEERTDEGELEGYTVFETDDYPFEIEDACIRAVGKEAYTLYKELYILGLPIEQVVSKYGISANACRVRGSRIKQKLQKYFRSNL